MGFKLTTWVAGIVASTLLASPLPCLGSELETAIQVLVNRHDFESEITLSKLQIFETRAVLGFEFEQTVELSNLPTSFENLYENLVGLIAALRPDISQIDLLVGHPGQQLRAPPLVAQAKAKQRRRPNNNNNLRPLPRYPHGQSLRGRTIAISPGHGWIYSSNTQDYRTQRSRIRWTNCGDCRGIVEDFETHEIVTQHLIPLLEGAGAKVILVRERSHARQQQISDDRDSSYREISGQFNEGSSPGGHNDKYRVSSDINAQTEWTLTAPYTGEHFLSLWFVAGGNRYDNAILEVETPKNIHEFILDQTSHGQRWSPIYPFGLFESEELRVRLKSPNSSNAVLIADAARLGAGKHSSGHPWWEMGAKPFATHQNAPADIQSIGDVSIRPIYAEWYDADIYVSVHSNASGQENSTASGTSSYRYNCGQFSGSDPSPSQCDDPVGSDRLQEIIHNAMVNAIRGNWDTEWLDRGTKVANFGELRNLDDIPGVLLETAFHDNVRQSQSSARKMTDNQALHDPRFRNILAYGIYQGISQYFNETAPFLAAPPQAIAAQRINSHTVEIHFEESTDALSYRVYTACGHPDFDDGQVFSKSPIQLPNLPSQEACFFKLSALNAAGEGLSSKIVSARPSRRPAQILIIDAYQRQDAWVEMRDNPQNTSMIHGLALLDESVAFDGATEAAITQGLISISDYDGIILALGRESVEHKILSKEIRQTLLTFDGAIFASGSEIAWTLDAQGDEESRAFLASVFGASFAEDDAGVNEVQAATNEWLQSIQGVIALEDGTSTAIEARSSDVLLPQDGASILMTYAGPNTVAAVRKNRNLLLGFALDSIASSVIREKVLSSWVGQAIALAPEEIEPGSADAGTGTPDAISVDGGVITDATTSTQDASPIVRSFRALSPHPIRGGCRCDAHSDRRSNSQTSLLILALLLIAGFRRSRPLPKERF